MATFIPGGGDGISGNQAGVTTVDAADLPANPAIANLVSGIMVKWGDGLGQGVDLSFSIFGDSYYLSDYVNGGLPMAEPLTPEQVDAAIMAMNAWGAVSGLTFHEVIDSSTVAGDLRWAGTSDPAEDTAHAEFPAPTAQAGDIWFGTLSGNYAAPVQGDYAYATFMHELGHALGLNHPHHSDPAYKPLPGEDQLKYSVMSYASYAGAGHDGYVNDIFPTTPMLNDIQAIQWLYGANMTTNTGDDIYTWTPGAAIFETLWDAGGNDTLSAEGQEEACLIDLNSGEWSEIGAAFSNGQEMVRDCLTIAYGSVIENAVGSDNDDGLIGNDAGNVLSGGLGNDTLKGGGGNDTLAGGEGDDVFYVSDTGDEVMESAGGGWDRVIASADHVLGDECEVLYLRGAGAIEGHGNAGDNRLYGNEADNTLSGGDGRDLLNGGLGDDFLSGGLGDDTYIVDSAGDTLFELDGEGIDRVIAKTSVVLSDNIERLNLLEGFAAAVSATGNGLDNVLKGNSADNVLTGMTGRDLLIGQAGNDTYVFGRGDGRDTVVDTDGNQDVLSFLSGIGHDQLWFTRRGDSLVVSVIGAADSVTVRDWYAGAGHQVEEIRTEDGGHVLAAANVDLLVSAMATLRAPSPGQTDLSQTQHTVLDSVIAAAWS